MGTWMTTVFPWTLPPGDDGAPFASIPFEAVRMSPEEYSRALMHHSLRGESGRYTQVKPQEESAPDEGR